MAAFPLLRRRDPWWESDGRAARRARRRQRFVASVAFLAALTAVGGAAVGWAIQLGVASALGLHIALGIG
jgi:hypothetical protein